ncbi:Hypothetical_protein [Hexamita inflata]|uniref:Hypothetical_protein n=1 Tax=Hexamita inflata TaxID=28002 RepID=A0AA86N4P3_9EUKA|nr:Hypothetical protein HINF_LOCUS642 [Hexamita inflata]
MLGDSSVLRIPTFKLQTVPSKTRPSTRTHKLVDLLEHYKLDQLYYCLFAKFLTSLQQLRFMQVGQLDSLTILHLLYFRIVQQAIVQQLEQVRMPVDLQELSVRITTHAPSKQSPLRQAQQKFQVQLTLELRWDTNTQHTQQQTQFQREKTMQIMLNSSTVQTSQQLVE